MKMWIKIIVYNKKCNKQKQWLLAARTSHWPKQTAVQTRLGKCECERRPLPLNCSLCVTLLPNWLAALQSSAFVCCPRFLSLFLSLSFFTCSFQWSVETLAFSASVLQCFPMFSMFCCQNGLEKRVKIFSWTWMLITRQQLRQRLNKT